MPAFVPPKTTSRLGRQRDASTASPGAASKAAMPYPMATSASRSSSTRILSVVLPLGLLLVYMIHSRHPLLPSFASPKDGSGSATNYSASFDEAARARIGSNTSRIAVCFTGHVGTLPRVHRQNLGVLSRLSTVPPAHFYVLDLHDDYRDARTGRHYTAAHEIGSISPILEQAHALAVDTLSLPSLTSAARQRSASCVGEHTPVSDDTETHFSHAYPSLLAARQCFQLVQREEQRSGIAYDWVLRMRPDMHIAVRLPDGGAPPRVHMSGLAMALIPRALADSFFSIVDAFEGDACKRIEAVDDRACAKYSYVSTSPECLMVKWLHLRNIVPSNGVYVNRRIVYPDHE